MSKTISILFLASAALHAAVLGLVRFDSAQVIQAGSPFRVSIQASSPASNAEISDLNQKPVKSVVREGSVSEIPASIPLANKQITSTQVIKPDFSQQQDKPESKQKTVSVIVESIQHTATPSVSTNNMDASSSDQSLQLSQKTASLLRIDLEQAFALHFYYPRLAIKRGWQGEVQLGIRIEANGNLSQIRILQGSGYGLLDKAAMKSLNEIEVLPKAIALLNGKNLDLILPVKYRLL